MDAIANTATETLAKSIESFFILPPGLLPQNEPALAENRSLWAMGGKNHQN
jgi:hypothetical protein